jgi:hypothetical protein
MNRTAKSALVGIASLFAVTSASAESSGTYTALVTSNNAGGDSGATSQLIQGVADLDNCRKIAASVKSTTYTSVVCLNKRGEVEGSNTCRASSLNAPSSCTPN